MTLDLLDQKFGRLTATNELRREGSITRRLCKCDCGVMIWIPTQRLTSGHTQSCGCYRVEARQIEYGRAARNEVLDGYKRDAAKRGFEWSISDYAFDSITRSCCYYCGAHASTRRKGRRGNGDFIYNGIDRLTPTRGYVYGNVVPCCQICNRAKSDLTPEQFMLWIKRLAWRYREVML